MSPVFQPLGNTRQTIGATAALLSSVPAGVSHALIRVISGGVTYRDDSTDPTSSTGFPLQAGDTLRYDGDFTKLKLIRSGASDATIAVAFYG